MTSTFSTRSFFAGLAGVALFYILVFTYVTLNAEKTLERLQNSLVSETLLLKNTIRAEPLKDQSASISEDGGLHEDAPPAPSDINIMPPAPVEGLTELDPKTGQILPKKNSRGYSPFDAYKKPFTTNGQPLIAIGVFGIDESDIGVLPEHASLILSPYAQDLKTFQDTAREQGYETWLYIPSETSNFPQTDPGPQALLTTEGLQYNQERLAGILSRASGYAGIAVHMDSTFLRVKPIVNAVLGNAMKRGLGYFEMNTKAPAFFKSLVKENKAPYAANQAGGPDNLFSTLEARAKNVGSVTAMVSLDEVNRDEFIQWVNTLESKGFQIAPLSAVAER